VAAEEAGSESRAPRNPASRRCRDPVCRLSRPTEEVVQGGTEGHFEFAGRLGEAGCGRPGRLRWDSIGTQPKLAARGRNPLLAAFMSAVT
jgi:hypothetical protein